MWSLVQHQLANARLLATLEKRRPRQASLRRGVSTAYYAVFQSLCVTCADTLVGKGKPWDVFTPVFRSLEHGRVARTRLQSSVATTSELKRFGLAFKELQAAREWADYNPEPRPSFEEGRKSSPFTREETLTLIGLAEEAVAILDGLNEYARLRLATRLVARMRN